MKKMKWLIHDIPDEEYLVVEDKTAAIAAIKNRLENFDSLPEDFIVYTLDKQFKVVTTTQIVEVRWKQGN